MVVTVVVARWRGGDRLFELFDLVGQKGGSESTGHGKLACLEVTLIKFGDERECSYRVVLGGHGQCYNR
jgi:hypothetical protein